MDRRLTRTQVRSRPETIWPEVWSSIPKCAQKTAKKLEYGKTSNLHAANQRKKVHDILPDEAEEFDAIVQHARKKLDRDSSGTSNALRQTNTHPDR